MAVNHEEVTSAIIEAIVLKRYRDIDDIVEDHIGNLTQVLHSRTPVFDAVETILFDNAHLPEDQRTFALGLVTEGLTHIFDKVEQKLASGDKSDKELLKQFVHHSCNHISHTSMLKSGGTVRDMVESYAGVDFTRRPYDKAYLDVYKFINKYGLEQTKELARERLKINTSNDKGRQL